MVVVVVRVERICVGEGSILERHGEKKASPNVRNTEFNHNNESQNHWGAARVSRRVSQHVPRRRCGGALAAFALALPRASPAILRASGLQRWRLGANCAITIAILYNVFPCRDGG